MDKKKGKGKSIEFIDEWFENSIYVLGGCLLAAAVQLACMGSFVVIDWRMALIPVAGLLITLIDEGGGEGGKKDDRASKP